MDNELIVRLAQARAQLEMVRKNRIAMLAEVTESAQYKAVLQSEAEATAAINAVETEIKEQALGAWTATGSKKPHPAVNVKVTQKPVYDPAVALTWAMTNLVAATTPPTPRGLDVSKFEKWVKDNPPGFVTFIEVPTVTFAKDLSEYIKQVAE